MKLLLVSLLALAVVGLPAAQAEACRCDDPTVPAASCCCGSSADAQGCDCGCGGTDQGERDELSDGCNCDDTQPQSAPADPQDDRLSPGEAIATVNPSCAEAPARAAAPQASTSPLPPGYRLPLLL